MKNSNVERIRAELIASAPWRADAQSGCVWDANGKLPWLLLNERAGESK